MNASQISEIINHIKATLQKHAPRTLLGNLKEELSKPFKVLIATILSHRTRDEVTLVAVKRLFSKYPNTEALSLARRNDVELLIKPVGFYRVKARRIIEVAGIIVNRFCGRVPDKMEELLTLPSVGRKTANAVLAFGFNKPSLIIDTHAHRITNRLGLVKTRHPDETEMELREKIDERYWQPLNELLVPFGKVICKPIKPLCQLCLLTSVCDYFNLLKQSITKE
ncbi:MAG: endonuclease III domain-containing protein [Nitrososphaerales archaeon]